MIRVYTTNDAHAAVISAAAEAKGLQAQTHTALDNLELAAAIDDLSVLVFDLTAAAFSTDKVVTALDTLDSERVPPVLYLLGSAADIEVITQSGSIINQDYAFLPLEVPRIAARLEVLKLLGARRKLTMETAITDRLTGLYNRKYFLRRLEEEMYRSVRYGYRVGVLLADVDFDAPGHELTEEAGTVVVKRIADFFKDRLRKSDIVARFKWDDFAFLLPDIAQEDGLAVALDVKRKLERLPVKVEGLDIAIKAAIGYVCLPADGLDTAIDVAAALEDCAFLAKRELSGISTYEPESGVAQPA
jgi:diguanylate cyclase (GGDEF)-like protein